MKTINSVVAPDTRSASNLDTQRYLPRGVSSKIKRNERRLQRRELRSELPSLHACMDEYRAHELMKTQSQRSLKLVKSNHKQAVMSVPMKSINVTVFRKQPGHRVTSELLSMNVPLMAA